MESLQQTKPKYVEEIRIIMTELMANLVSQQSDVMKQLEKIQTKQKQVLAQMMELSHTSIFPHKMNQYITLELAKLIEMWADV